MIREFESGWQKNNEAWAVETTPEACVEDEINRFFERKMALDVREEYLAQHLLDAPNEGVLWLVAFEDYLANTKQFSTMLDRDPQRAHQLIARHVRKVPFSAITTLVFNQVLHNIMPLLENGEPLCPQPDKRAYSVTIASLLPSDQPLEGNAAAFFHCMHQLQHRGWKETLARITDPEHHYYPLWECFEAAHSVLGYANRWSDFSAEQQCYQTAEDNALVSLELLTHIRAEYVEECAVSEREPSAYAAVWRTMRSADRLGWAASGNAESIVKRFRPIVWPSTFWSLRKAPQRSGC